MTIFTVIFAITSLLGVLSNLCLFLKLLLSTQKPFHSFHKFCIVKSVTNLTISCVFSFWTAPLSYFLVSLESTPRVLNIVLSHLLTRFCNILGPCILNCMALNRFMAIHFPLATIKHNTFPFTNIAILICLSLSAVPGVYSFLENCFVKFDPIKLTFQHEGADILSWYIKFTICVLTVSSNIINLAIIVKLLKNKMAGISELEKQKRLKKYKLMFVQSVFQSLLQMTDVVNGKYLVKLVDSPTWKFVVGCFSSTLVYVLDGIIMLYFYCKLDVLHPNRRASTMSVAIGTNSVGSRTNSDSDSHNSPLIRVCVFVAPTDHFPPMLLFYILSLALISFSGVILNSYLMWKFCTSKKKPISSFHKLCLAKGVPNFTITSIFAFWVVPLSILQIELEDIPRIPNIALGMLLGQYCYLLGPHMQMCMAVNRFLAIYFPFAKLKFAKYPVTNVAIIGCLLLSMTPIVASFQQQCFFVFDPPMMFFHYDCSIPYSFSIFKHIIAMSAFSNIVNVLIFAKLLKDKVGGMNANQQSKRNKRSVRMYVQSVLQDLLQVIDVLNFKFVAKLIDAFWWKFIFYCLFFAFVYVLDGMIMMYFNPEVNIVYFFKKREIKLNVIGVKPSAEHSNKTSPII